MSRIICVAFDENALMDPFVVGTIAMFEVTAPSRAFSVETTGCDAPCGQSVKKPNDEGGTTVAFRTNASADTGAPQPLVTTPTSLAPLNGGEPAGLRVSMTRHGVTL